MGSNDGVHYLKSLIGTGTQYIKTDIPVTEETLVETSVFIENWNTVYMNLFGTINNDFCVIRRAENDVIRLSYKETNKMINVTIPARFYISADAANRRFFVNDDSAVFDPSDNAFTTMPIWIFAKAQGSVTNPSPDKIGAFKLYSFLIKEGGQWRADLHPALDGDGVACLYDRVSKTYLYNAGTGQFEYEELTE